MKGVYNRGWVAKLSLVSLLVLLPMNSFAASQVSGSMKAESPSGWSTPSTNSARGRYQSQQQMHTQQRGGNRGYSPSQSSPSSMMSAFGEARPYVSGSYQVGLYYYDNALTGNEQGSGAVTDQVVSYSKNGVGQSGYKPSYKFSFTNFGLALGCAFKDGVRVEVEGLYSQIDVDDDGYPSGASAKGFELQRKGESFFFNAVNNVSLRPFVSLLPTTPAPVRPALTPASVTTGYVNLGTQYTLDKVLLKAIFANVYVDFPVSQYSVVPYIGAGVGPSFTSILGLKDELKFAYQVKAGVSFAYNDATAFYVGGRLLGLFSDDWNKVKPITALPAYQAQTYSVSLGVLTSGRTAIAASTDSKIKYGIGPIGYVEAGLRIGF